MMLNKNEVEAQDTFAVESGYAGYRSWTSARSILLKLAGLRPDNLEWQERLLTAMRRTDDAVQFLKARSSLSKPFPSRPL
jgi:hypothetical protein